ncbi:MAG TPA: acyl-CoA dehydrogenase family protein [Methylomirabilota bacterium]|nr:acyl-CoA dehydrogenase family protein [Methylomirabilota bacterium]
MSNTNREEVDYIERAGALAPEIEARADQIEQERRLPEPVLAALFEAGLFRLLLPRSLDGGEVDPVTFARVMEEIAKADASTAWCLCQASGCSMSAAYLSHDVAMEIFGRDRRAVLAWGPGPGARAIAVDGGYRVTGTWSFASGGRHATWLGAHCPISDSDGSPRRTSNGKLVERTMLFPAASATFVDVWHVSGLKGTGSDAYTVSDLFVPHDHSISRDDPAERRQPGLIYCFPTGSFYASGFASVALGIARRMLDAFVSLAREKTPRGYKRPLANNAVIQSQVGQAEAQLSSARRFLMGSLADIWGAVGSSGTLTMDQRMLIRLASTYAIHQAKAVADVTHHAAGATSIFIDSAFDRGFRDIHAVTQQLQGRQAHFETVGQFMLGIEPDTTFL